MWQIILGFGLFFLILEMFTPVLFFLNFAIAAFICAVLSLYTQDISLLVITFSVLSVILIYTLRPLLVSKTKNKKLETGMESKYIDKTAKVLEDIDKNSGAISLYDERWQARNIDDGVIPAGSRVKIVNYESIIMYVKKTDD